MVYRENPENTQPNQDPTDLECRLCGAQRASVVDGVVSEVQIILVTYEYGRFVQNYEVCSAPEPISQGRTGNVAWQNLMYIGGLRGSNGTNKENNYSLTSFMPLSH